MIARKSPRIIHVSIRSATKRSIHPLQDNHPVRLTIFFFTILFKQFSLFR